MSKGWLLVTMLAMLGGIVLPGASPAQQPAKSSVLGSYRCEPEPSPCASQTMTIVQSGSDLALRNDQGEFAAAKQTSPITISAGAIMNSIGVILPDGSIQWSNGTKWRKQ